MKYKWLEDIPTCDELSQAIGCPVKSITKGDIVIGYGETAPDGSYSEITRKGIEVEFEQEPTVEQLERLDGIFSLHNLKREGGRDLIAEIDQLKQKIDSIEPRRL